MGMKIGEFFRGETNNVDQNRTAQMTSARTAALLQQQIRSLVPGQTLQGEILSQKDGEIQIKVLEDFILNARLDGSMNIEVGKNMIFEVKNNGSLLTLSPLFTNTATDANVLKALDMAGLPVNDDTVDMTRQMMEGGLSIDRNSLQQMFREVNAYTQAEAVDLVRLHMLSMPVNETNVNQMVSYRNLNHQLLNGMNQILGELPEVFSNLLEKGNVQEAVELYRNMLELAASAESGDGSAPGAIASSENGQTGENPMVRENPMVKENSVVREFSASTETPEPARGASDADVIGLQKAETSGEDGGHDRAGSIVTDMGEAAAKLQEVSVRLQETAAAWADKQTAGGQLDKLLKPLLQQMLKQWTIQPEEVADSKEVEKLYQRLEHQIKGLAKALEGAAQTDTPAYKATGNLSQNLDFLQQVNQMYSYVQLPLRLQQGNAHGDLYVYSNKKHLAMKEGQISALLHLDMEHLGPVDVYVAMNYEKVNTKFFVQDDAMLDFLEEHMDILTNRLKKRGYDCNFTMQLRGDSKEGRGGIGELLQAQNHVPLSEYAFDVRT